MKMERKNNPALKIKATSTQDPLVFGDKEKILNYLKSISDRPRLNYALYEESVYKIHGARGSSWNGKAEGPYAEKEFENSIVVGRFGEVILYALSKPEFYFLNK